MTFSYNINKRPPRPECEIFVSNTRQKEKVETVKSIADTGADMTIIPNNVISSLGNLTQGEDVISRGVNGVEVRRRTYLVNITIGDQYFENHLVAGFPKQYALIGRDILNQNKALFDANGNIWRLNCSESCD
jgi:predicted aspartyl protease